MTISQVASVYPARTECEVWLRDGDGLERIMSGTVDELRDWPCYQVVRVEAADTDFIDITVW